MKSNQVKYGQLVQELANDYNKGRDSYPLSLGAAYELMLHDVRHQDSRQQSHGSPGMAFNTVGGSEMVSATNTQPNPRPDVTCHKCGKVGHFSNKCAEDKHANGTALCTVAQESDADGVEDDGFLVVSPVVGEDVNLALLGSMDDDSDGSYIDEFNFLNDGAVAEMQYKSFESELTKQHKAATGRAVPRWWILLDSQSTVNVFCNRKLLKNIRKAPTTCRISCNAGTVIVTMIGDLPGYPDPVWYHSGGIANILSLYQVAQHCRVQYDSGEDGAAFHVTKPDGSIRDFKPSVSGLHYCNVREHETVLINTVDDKKSNYTVRA
jgi:hypothetical protein